MKFSRRIASAVFALVTATPVAAEVCDYRPSKFLGDNGSKAALGTATSVGTAGGVAYAAGFYTLVHATTGATMLGSTMAGASAAGTVGIMAGTGGAIGATAAIVMNPIVWIPTIIAGAGGGGMELVCAYFVDERVTDYDKVLAQMKAFEEHADPEFFILRTKVVDPYISIKGEDGKWSRYNIENLYIVEGILMHRDFARNTRIGRIVFVPTEGEEKDAQPKE